MKQLSKETHHILHLLAKRKSPDFAFDNELQWWLADWQCLICNVYMFNMIKRDESALSFISQHGLQHLKEYNLLPLL